MNKSSQSILLVFASSLEAKTLSEWLQSFDKERDTYILNGLGVRLLVTGPGIFHSVYSVMKVLSSEKPGLIIDAGICGSFGRCKIGEVIQVKQDEFADCGFTLADGTFVSVFDMNFVDADAPPFSGGKLKLSTFDDLPLPEVKAITVNQCSGSEVQIKRRVKDFRADIETMEGAAVAYAAMKEDIDFRQIRSVSNQVEVRNRDSWDIPQAVSNLTDVLKSILIKKAGL